MAEDGVRFLLNTRDHRSELLMALVGWLVGGESLQGQEDRFWRLNPNMIS